MPKVMDAGYANIISIEADDGHWEGKGSKNGKEFEFHVDPIRAQSPKISKTIDVALKKAGSGARPGPNRPD